MNYLAGILDKYNNDMLDPAAQIILPYSVTIGSTTYRGVSACGRIRRWHPVLRQGDR